MREYIIKFENDVPISELASGTTIRALINITDDRDEIIRCKDCKYYQKGHHSDDWLWCMMNHHYTDEEKHCAWAERKEE